MANRIEVLKSALTELGFKFVDAFAAKGGKAIESFTTVITNFDPTPIINFLKTAFSVIVKVVKILWKMRSVIKIAAISFVIFKTAVAATVIVAELLGAVIGTVKTIMTVFTGVVKILNAAFIASPIGWFVLGIGALIAAVILCIKYWDAITAALSRAWEWIKKNQEAILNLVTIFTGPFGVIISIVREFWNEWDRITQAFTNGGIIAGLKQIGATILSALLAPLQGIFELIAKVPYIGEPFKAMAGGIDKFRDTIKGVDGAEAINKAQGAVSYGGVGQTGTGGSAPELAPVSPAQQLAYYSRQDNYQHAEISVRAEQGTQARISKPPKSPSFNLIASGSY